jgi:hypothetical protein
MEQRFCRGFTAAEKTELWDRWQRGESLKARHAIALVRIDSLFVPALDHSVGERFRFRTRVQFSH